MGLDQSAYHKDEDGHCNTIQDWRKHNALEGWMQSLWVTKGGKGEFNCEVMELDVHDIKQLEALVVNDELPETIGFFLGGDSRHSEYQKEKDLAFIKDAYKILAEGKKIYYSSGS